MPQRAIEMILARQLASYLATPIVIIDAQGTLVFYNEPAERLMGRRFEETGEMSVGEWVQAAKPTDDAGVPVPPTRVPTMVALSERQPVHAFLWLVGIDNVRRRIETTAFPLLGQAGRHIGAMAIFWEAPLP